MKYVIFHGNWFRPNQATIGKIYTFPDIVLDDGIELSLNADMRYWVGIFTENTEEEYNKQEGINQEVTFPIFN